MKIKFKKILPILGLLSIGVAAPIISTACSSTSETPNNDSSTGGQIPPGSEGTDTEKPNPENKKITFNSEAFNKYFNELNDATYTDLSQQIDPITNLVQQNHIETFLTTNLGFSNGDPNKVENVKVSLIEKVPASQEGEGPKGSLFNTPSTGSGETGVTPAPEKLLNAEIVMTLKEGNAWNEEGLPDNASVTENNKTLTLKDVTTKVKIVEIGFSDDGTKLETEIKSHLDKLTKKEDISKIEKDILDSINGIKNDAGGMSKSVPNTIDKVASKVVIELEKDNALLEETINSPSVGTSIKEKANVTIYFRGNVHFTIAVDNTKFVLLKSESKTAIKTKQPLDTGINVEQQPGPQK